MSPSSSGSELQFRTYAFAMEDVSQVGEARRFAAGIAHQVGFSETRMARVGIIVNELGNNLISHATGGELLLRVIPHSTSAKPHDGVGIEILSVDRGPGIIDTQSSLRDGVTTGTTPGTGLGAVSRQADVFDIYSQLEKGTAVVAQIYKTDDAFKATEAEEFFIGAVSLPLRGENVCGDGYLINLDCGELSILVVDGLGHGPMAHEAANEAIDIFNLNYSEPAENLVQLIHGRLRSTRGAAIFLVKTEGDNVISSGIGNIRALIQEPTKTRTLISQNGTAGLQIRSARANTSPWDRHNLLIFHSDGLSTKTDLLAYPGLQYRHPSLVAGILNRDFSRGRDDSTVVVIGPKQ